MGQLLDGRTLDWKETKQEASKLRLAATKQLVRNLQANISHSQPVNSLRWGYEIEFFTVRLNQNDVELLPVASTLLSLLNNNATHPVQVQTASKQLEPTDDDKELIVADNNIQHQSYCGKWNPEYAAFMVESIPSQPFLLSSPALGSQVLYQMQYQRKFLHRTLQNNYGPSCYALTIGSFPMLGAVPNAECCKNSLSHLFPTRFINNHPRFSTLTRNIVSRRGNIPVNIQLPAFPDEFSHAKRIKMDAMGFGMGCCCLQTTTELPTFQDACYVYDELLAIAPIMLALTASSPAFRAMLSGEDCRWSVLEGAVDDRTAAEMQISNVTSRFAPSLIYMHESNDHLNDIELDIDGNVLYTLRQQTRTSSPFSKHYAHIFRKDPVVAYSNTDYENESCGSEFIDALQSTNWNSVRFKVPADGNGWRVEFRPMEVQPTDMENAAFCLFIEGLILALCNSRLVTNNDIELSAPLTLDSPSKQLKMCQKSKDLCSADEIKTKNQKSIDPSLSSFTMPASKVAANFKRAVVNDAVLKEKFFWAGKEISTDSIVNDTENGLLAFIKRYAPQYSNENEQFLQLVSRRASGEERTAAKKMRDFVLSHSEYQKDSVISDKIMHDLTVSLLK